MTTDPRSVLSSGHWQLPYFKQRITVKQWRQMLLDEGDHIIFEGHFCPLIAKDLGYGIVEISKDLTSLV